jgi:hypothetical protein
MFKSGDVVYFRMPYKRICMTFDVKASIGDGRNIPETKKEVSLA